MTKDYVYCRDCKHYGSSGEFFDSTKHICNSYPVEKYNWYHSYPEYADPREKNKDNTCAEYTEKGTIGRLFDRLVGN